MSVASLELQLALSKLSTSVDTMRRIEVIPPELFDVAAQVVDAYRKTLAERPCETCGGWGEVQTQRGTAVPCEDCDGPVTGKKRCWPCRGRGVVSMMVEKTATGLVRADVDCPKCRGSGRS
jgi:DnaJ-class molecular chaperone